MDDPGCGKQVIVGEEMGKKGNPTPTDGVLGTSLSRQVGFMEHTEPWHSLLPPAAACRLEFGSLT